MNLFLPPAPPLHPMMQVRCRVSPVVSLGHGPLGERRYVPLLGGEVDGPELQGEVVEGGVDWQTARSRSPRTMRSARATALSSRCRAWACATGRPR
jgi:hypothetical protein